MRNIGFLSLLIGVLVWSAGGCTRPAATAIAPTRDELPHFEQIEPVLPLSVGVEGRGERARTDLVPTFREPEPTAEELAILGQPEEMNWLEFYRPPGVDHTLPDLAGASVSVHGFGGASTGRTLSRAPAGVGSGLGGAATATLQRREVSYGNSGRSERVSAPGPESSVRVGTGSGNRVAARQTRRVP